ncbi:hypothetical protein [Frigidibacter mobilis]|uniref:hypothetical protein n=1 Tax=Frigidibacter mobilis TaxID=1335048 RepID=UPI0014125DFA|nr:hypothetical protein [Frigidibacter mobilis]
MFFDMFRTVCFDTDWPTAQEAGDMEFLGFERMGGESVRRRYRFDALMIASFLPPDDSDAPGGVCTLDTKAARAGSIREMLKTWDFAGNPQADEVKDGVRYTYWDVKYRRNRGAVLLTEKSSVSSNLVSLSLVGE